MYVADAIAETRRHLGGDRDRLNRLSQNINSGTETIPFTYPLVGVTAGALLELDDELMYVWEHDPEAKTALVSRGHAGTFPANHDQGSTVRVAPRLTVREIHRAMGDEVAALASEGLYRRASLPLTWNYSNNGYDISEAVGMISPYGIELDLGGGRKTWVYSWRREDTFLRTKHCYNGAAVLHYRQEFGTLELSTDSLEDIGLPASAADIVPLGAAFRLLTSRESIRVDPEAHLHARDGADLPPMSVARQARALKEYRDLRLGQEVQRLRERWPMRAK